MPGIFGALGLNDTDRVFASTQGQQVIYDAITAYLNRVNADIAQAMSVFVEGTTENHTERYKLPGGGYLQRRGQQAQPGAVKATGSWDVAYPLEDFGAQIAGDDVSMAYMLVGDLDRHVSSVVIQNVNTVRFEMLKAIFNSTAGTFIDPNWGSLTIQRLANGDAVTYPPVIGAVAEATETHYIETNYASASISDTNNPYATIASELEEHFGKMQGGPNIVAFINSAQVAVTEALTDFVELPDSYVMPGSQTATLTGLPAGHPGRVIGRTNGCWIVEWDFIPANYIVGIYVDAPKPLKMRVDPADTGLGTGLQLVATDERFPFESSFWRHRFGFGVSNRLNGIVLELGTGGSYTVPTAYQ